MKKKILIIGSTGKLGSKLLNFAAKKSISIHAITCYINKKKLLEQKKKYDVKKTFVLSKDSDKDIFYKYLEQNIDVIYFLDYGSISLKYLNHFLKFNTKSLIAIANKEMIIAGGKFLQKKIKNTKNKFIPLDSEHFSLINTNIKSENINKIFITASGGPFYFNKRINLSKVSSKKVLSHPKWKMGINNLIDSSNFVNKILEIYELSFIYDIPLNKIDFLISKEAYIHSIVHFSDNTLSINCFHNDMLITLTKPLLNLYKNKNIKINQNYLNINKLNIEIPNDKRFKILKYQNKLMKLSHSEQIQLMIINNYAHKLYLSNKLKYNKIVDYIMSEISVKSKIIKFNSFESILDFISLQNKYYDTNV